MNLSTESYLAFSIYLGFLVVMIFLIFLAAQLLPKEKEPEMTIETFFASARAFENTYLQALRTARDPEDLEFLGTVKHLYNRYGVKAPLTQEAYEKLSSF